MNKYIDISDITLKTERMILRPWRETDLDDFFEYAKVDGVGQMAGWPPHKTIDDSRFILNLFISERKTFAIEYRGKVIGSIGIEKYNEEEFPEFDKKYAREIGYVLSKDYWGQGLMPEAVKSVIKYLFEKENLDIILCGHFKDNYQSYRVQEKCKFKHYKEVNYRTIMGNIKPTWMSILDRKEWEKT